LLSGAAVADVSRKYAVGDSALYRHARAHLSATVLREMRASAEAGSTDLIEKLVEALDDVSAVRTHALLAGHASTLLRAASATQSLVETLLDRLGIDNIETVRLLREGENFAFALSKT